MEAMAAAREDFDELTGAGMKGHVLTLLSPVKSF